MSIVVVLNRPQNRFNVASVIRAMRNFGLENLRLVEPSEFDPFRLEGIAHGTGDVIERVKVFDTLDAALADCTHVVGLTARFRTVKRNMQTAREAAPEILEASVSGLAALLLGTEDKGLTNDELDLCHRAVTIETTAEHPSLNLAHAFALMAYELFLASGESRPFKPPRRVAESATQDDLERLSEDIERSLDAIGFFKSKKPANIMRTVRGLLHRVPMDKREAKLLKAMVLEVVYYLERVGLRK